MAFGRYLSALCLAGGLFALLNLMADRKRLVPGGRSSAVMPPGDIAPWDSGSSAGSSAHVRVRRDAASITVHSLTAEEQAFIVDQHNKERRGVTPKASNMAKLVSQTFGYFADVLFVVVEL